jgi:hypothetical protein
MLSRMRAVVWAGSALVVQWIFAWLVVLSEGRLATPGWAGLDRHVSTPEILVIAASSPVLVSGLCGVCDEAESPHLARRFAAIVLWVTAIVFVNPWVVYQSQVQGVAERLALWSWPVSGLAFALALHWSSLWKTNRRRVMRVVLVLLAAGVLIHRSPPASSRAYIAERAVVMREIVTVRSCVGAAFPLIVTEHGMQFVVTYSTGLPAVSQPPQASTPVDSAWWFFRVPPRAAAFVDRRFDGCVIGSWALAPKTSMRAWLDTLPPGPKGDVALANPVHIGETFLGVTSVLGPDGFLHLVRSDSAR